MNKDVIKLKEMYKKGMKVELLEDMKDPYNSRNKKGLKGIITLVDDIGTIMVNWENGSSLGLIANIDSFRII